MAAPKMGDEKSALQAYEDGLKILPNDPQLLYQAANVRSSLGQSKQALELYQAATTFDPSHAAAYTNMGTLLQGRSENEAAERVFSLATKLQPTLAEAYTNLGTVRHDLGKLSQASKDCETHGQTDCCHGVIDYVTACTCQKSQKVYTNL